MSDSPSKHVIGWLADLMEVDGQEDGCILLVTPGGMELRISGLPRSQLQSLAPFLFQRCQLRIEVLPEDKNEQGGPTKTPGENPR